VLRVPVARKGVLPGVTIDVPALPERRLGPGRYHLDARLHGAGRVLRAHGAMTLYGVDTVRSEGARLTRLDSPAAIADRPVELRGSFLNTGNVRYAPAARLEVRAVDAGGTVSSVPVASRFLKADAAAPGREGAITGSLTLPEGRAFQLTLRLLAAGRELGVQSVRVEVRDPPALTDRLSDLLRRNAIVLLAGAFGLLLLGATLTLRYVARLKAALR
jgi:hypothetical protein